LALAAAYEQLQERRKDAEQKKRDAQLVAQYVEAISSGEMSFEEAMQRVIAAERETRECAEHDASARQLFLDGLEGILSWCKEWVRQRTDEHLSWYTESGAPGSETTATAEDVAAAIKDLERVRMITFAPRPGKRDNDGLKTTRPARPPARARETGPRPGTSGAAGEPAPTGPRGNFQDSRNFFRLCPSRQPLLTCG
jgi:hypothetical protein